MKFATRRTQFYLKSICMLALMAMTTAHAAENWPQFRGDGARGIADDPQLPMEWSATKNVEWKTDIPGRGWASPVVWGNKVFLTTVVNMGETEALKKGLYFGGERPNASENTHQWKVLCLDLENGKVLWEQQVHEGSPAGSAHLKNSLASETPVVDGERLYCYFGNLGVYCFDLDGALLWSKKMDVKKTRYGWGTAASPALYGDRLYIINDNEEDSYLMALDKKTGEELWRVAREEKSNWSTPYIWKTEARTEIVTLGSGKVRSYDLDGKLLWSLEGMSTITIATPYEYDGLLYFSSGYVGDRNARPIYAIRPGATGDISLAEGQTANEYIAWCQPLAAPYNPSTLIYEDRLYVLYDRKQVASFEPKSGAQIYEQQRLPKGAGYTASPWAYKGHIFCLSEDGETQVVKAGDTFELVRTNTLAEDDTGMSTPAIVGDRLLIRTAARLYSIRK